MTTTSGISMHVADRTHELLAENRVILFPRRPGLALVAGQHAAYIVRATATDVTCTCRASRAGRYMCCHAAAAMARWAELMEGER